MSIRLLDFDLKAQLFSQVRSPSKCKRLMTNLLFNHPPQPLRLQLH